MKLKIKLSRKNMDVFKMLMGHISWEQCKQIKDRSCDNSYTVHEFHDVVYGVLVQLEQQTGPTK